MRVAPLVAVAAALFVASPAAGRVAVPRTSFVAVAGSSVAVYPRPGASQPLRMFGPRTGLGAPRVFLVRGRVGRWLDVLLPARPNGSTGWIRADRVTLAATHYAIVVELGAHLLTLTRDGAFVLQFPIGAGRSSTPT